MPIAGEVKEPSVRRTRLGVLGVLAGAWGSMCGIGGGLIAVPILHYMERLSLRAAVATALGLVAATTISATITELFVKQSALHWGIAGTLAAGTLLGTQLGFRAARRIPLRPLKAAFAVVLVVAGAQLLILGARGGPAETALGFEATGREYALSAVIGVAAGFVSPLLGIGGGLVAVPALLYGVPGLGYLGARATSLAMSVVSSLRSLRLYATTGLVDSRRALCLAAGGVLGAALGARIVYVPAVEEVARRMLGATLLWVAARFAFDALRGEPSAPREASDQA